MKRGSSEVRVKRGSTEVRVRRWSSEVRVKRRSSEASGHRREVRSSVGLHGPQAELEKKALVSEQRRSSAPPRGVAACFGAESVGTQTARSKEQTQRESTGWNLLGVL